MAHYRLILTLLIALLPIFSCTMLKLRGSHPEEIGAVAESSARLAQVITELIPDFGPRRAILEVGAGTGVFTEKLVAKLGPKDKLDVVELIPELCKILDAKFSNNPQVTLYCGDILHWLPAESYDYIVSGLPFNSFSADLVEQISDKYVAMIKDGGIISFFEYKWLSAIRMPFMDESEKTKFKATRSIIENFTSKYEKKTENVYLNIPPAMVHFLQVNES
jgi:phospholipid N-methyltransferase